MFEQAPGFITILRGPEHTYEFANATYRRLFGDRELIGKTVREAFPDLAGHLGQFLNFSSDPSRLGADRGHRFLGGLQRLAAVLQGS